MKKHHTGIVNSNDGKSYFYKRPVQHQGQDGRPDVNAGFTHAKRMRLPPVSPAPHAVVSCLLSFLTDLDKDDVVEVLRIRDTQAAHAMRVTPLLEVPVEIPTARGIIEKKKNTGQNQRCSNTSGATLKRWERFPG